MWALLRPDAEKVLKDKKAQTSLARYFAVIQDKKLAKFTISKRLPAQFNENQSTEELWQTYTKLTTEFHKTQKEIDTNYTNLKNMPTPEKSYLDLKIAIANRILRACHFCTRRCEANRIEGKLGYCKCGNNIAVSSIFEHMGEEPELVPSGTIFTMGCTMQCKHCQNYTISQWMETAETYKPEKLAKEVDRLRANGCRNANLVGGEPTPWLPQWLETFKHVRANVPIVWNSNSYYSPETAQLLTGFADIYLLDFKYGPGDCAQRISDATDYWTVCTRNHLEAKNHGEYFFAYQQVVQLVLLTLSTVYYPITYVQKYLPPSVIGIVSANPLSQAAEAMRQYAFAGNPIQPLALLNILIASIPFTIIGALAYLSALRAVQRKGKL